MFGSNAMGLQNVLEVGERWLEQGSGAQQVQSMHGTAWGKRHTSAVCLLPSCVSQVSKTVA